MRAEIFAAIRTLESLRIGDAVTVLSDGRTHRMTVSRAAHRSDGAYGSIESTRVTVTFGPGRYSTDVTAERLAAGTQILTVGHDNCPTDQRESTS